MFPSKVDCLSRIYFSCRNNVSRHESMTLGKVLPVPYSMPLLWWHTCQVPLKPRMHCSPMRCSSFQPSLGMLSAAHPPWPFFLVAVMCNRLASAGMHVQPLSRSKLGPEDEEAFTSLVMQALDRVVRLLAAITAFQRSVQRSSFEMVKHATLCTAHNRLQMQVSPCQERGDVWSAQYI